MINVAHLTADPALLRDRLEISSGVIRPTAPLDDGLPYAEHALIPRNDWRPLNDIEYQQLHAPRDQHRMWNTIWLLKAPQDKKTRIEEIAYQAIEVQRVASLDTQSDSLIQSLEEVMADFPGIKRAGPIFGIAQSPAKGGLYTLTPYRDNKHRTGLHFDSWDRLAWFDRRGGSNRISINSGTGDRYFLFAGETAVEIWNKFGRSGSVEEQGDLARSYLNAHPDTPIFRLRLKPGEAYMAPTENLIHDGSSFGKTSEDKHTTVRGFFTAGYCQPGALKAA